MKKTYTKPEIAFESFSLSKSIAAGCEVKTNTPSQLQCPYGKDDFGVPIFLDAVQACISKVNETANDTFCYHVPIDTNNLFNS